MSHVLIWLLAPLWAGSLCDGRYLLPRSELLPDCIYLLLVSESLAARHLLCFCKLFAESVQLSCADREIALHRLCLPPRSLCLFLTFLFQGCHLVLLDRKVLLQGMGACFFGYELFFDFLHLEQAGLHQNPLSSQEAFGSLNDRRRCGGHRRLPLLLCDKLHQLLHDITHLGLQVWNFCEPVALGLRCTCARLRLLQRSVSSRPGGA